jgi:putative flippase GtrA
MASDNTRGSWTLLMSRMLQFGAVSGAGLSIDFAFFSVLVEIGMRAGYANAISAFAGVAFVYFASIKKIFAYHEKFLFLLFGVYLLYQIVAVGVASLAVDAIVAHKVSPLIAKAAILPLTFTANYIFMSYLAQIKLSIPRLSS